MSISLTVYGFLDHKAVDLHKKTISQSNPHIQFIVYDSDIDGEDKHIFTENLHFGYGDQSKLRALFGVSKKSEVKRKKQKLKGMA